MEKEYPKVSWWLQDLYLDSSPIQGKGIFTHARIAKNSVVIRWGGTVFTDDDVKNGKALQHTYVGIGQGIYLANPSDSTPTLDDYMNHACDGNIWMDDEITLVARQDIAVGEELTADYALWLNMPEYRMKQPCNCGSRSCRGTITGLDWQLPDVQRRYEGHFSPFINVLIKNLKKIQL